MLADYYKHGRLVDAGTREQAAHLCAELRNELVRLGKVAETGVPLGLQATYAGVGDLVQARKNGWELAGSRATAKHRSTASSTASSIPARTAWVR
ncbi:hypothetical protein [Amycolatopsis sp. GM8]|uniref:hypothetical protein n=1 Tax=Amycolatopsis sp. GM8 TaxID=2896530 RepID=UPI001F3195B0|nr:hypothetical protein [Amycolatopsis sp. GM8]